MSTEPTETANEALLLFQTYPVLDKGHVRLVDYMGDDARVAEAARVSNGEGTTSFRDNEKLIRYLMRNQHTSPFEHVEFEFHVKMPIFVARQWQRHRTASINEISGRYSIMSEETYIPDTAHMNTQSATNKQARSEETLTEDDATWAMNEIEIMQEYAFQTYAELLDKGLAREAARMVLPLNTYTEFYWKINLHNLLHFIQLRDSDHAQYEIRVYAQILKEIARLVAPACVTAFEDYVQYGLRLSRKQLERLQKNCYDVHFSLAEMLGKP